MLNFLCNYTPYKPVRLKFKLRFINNTFPKQLNFEIDPNIDKTRNLDPGLR